MTCERQEDVYIRPRYPVDEPPTYRAQCSCGWTGPGRYRWITDSDWERHNRDAAEPAPESWDGGLREAIAQALADSDASAHGTYTWDECNGELRDGYRRYADVVLAMPEVAALRAKAAAADRVRALADELDRQAPEQEAWDGDVNVAYTDIADRIRRALDGPARTDRGRC